MILLLTFVFLTSYFAYALIPTIAKAPIAVSVQGHTGGAEAAKKQMDEAEILQGDAWEKMESGNVKEAMDLAEKALKIRMQWAPNSVLLAESLHQVGYLYAERGYRDDTDQTLKQKAEELYLQAIEMVPRSEMYILSI